MIIKFLNSVAREKESERRVAQANAAMNHLLSPYIAMEAELSLLDEQSQSLDELIDVEKRRLSNIKLDTLAAEHSVGAAFKAQDNQLKDQFYATGSSATLATELVTTPCFNEADYLRNRYRSVIEYGAIHDDDMNRLSSDIAPDEAVDIYFVVILRAISVSYRTWRNYTLPNLARLSYYAHGTQVAGRDQKRLKELYERLTTQEEFKKNPSYSASLDAQTALANQEPFKALIKQTNDDTAFRFCNLTDTDSSLIKAFVALGWDEIILRDYAEYLLLLFNSVKGRAPQRLNELKELIFGADSMGLDMTFEALDNVFEFTGYVGLPERTKGAVKSMLIKATQESYYFSDQVILALNSNAAND